MKKDAKSLPSLPGLDDPPTRERILRTAAHEFAVHGLAGARVERIAREAGVNKAMIYYHFSSKDDLYRDTIADIYRDAAENISVFLEGDEPLERVLEATAEYFAELMIKYPEFRSVLMRELAWPGPEILEMITGIVSSAGLPRRLLERFEDEMKTGGIREADPRQLLISFITMNLGYLLMEPLFIRLFDIDDRFEFLEKRKKEVLRIFMRGIRKR